MTNRGRSCGDPNTKRSLVERVRNLAGMLVVAFSIFVISVATLGWIALRDGSKGNEHLACPNSSEPLVRAATEHNLARVEELLAEGSEAQAVDTAGNTPLSCAVPLGHVEIVRALLEAGADPNTQARDGDSTLSDAARFCQSEVTRALLVAGADPDGTDRHGVTALQQAIDHADVETVVALLESAAETSRLLHDVANYNFDAERGEACAVVPTFTPEIAEALLEHAVDSTVVLNRAVRSRKLELIERALLAGASPNVGFEERLDDNAYLLAELSSAFGGEITPLPLVQYFETSEHPDWCVEEEENDPNTFACMRTTVLEPDARGRLVRPPLLVAAWYGETSTVQLLLDAGADPNAQATGGYTALHAAAVAGHQQVTELLVAAGAIAPKGVIAPGYLATRAAGTTEP